LALPPRPDSRLASSAEEACRDLLTEPMVNHSFRTWVFGCALAERDRRQLDPELFFVAAMLHDIGLGCPTFGECFTLAGARKVFDLADQSARGRDEVRPAAEAIAHHITPGLTVSVGGLLGFYLQGGSALDLGGLRAIDLPVDFVQEVSCTRWPSGAIGTEAGARWRAEAAMVKHGRADLLERWARFSALARTRPIPPRPCGTDTQLPHASSE
jgi:hypothetical protein